MSKRFTITIISCLAFFVFAYYVEAASFYTWWGNVGIGKIPTSNLDIIGGNNSTGVVNGTALCIASDCKASWAAVSGGGLSVGSLGQTVRHNGTSWLASSLLFNTGSNIGINTTNPQAILDVYATSTPGVVPGPPVSTTYNNSSTGYTGTIYTWTVPATATYTIDAYGAQAGTPTNYSSYYGGYGARMKGDFALTAGEVIKILVGQQGGTYSVESMGGGGTFVVKQTGNVPLVVAGGGGGSAASGRGYDAVTTTNGTTDRSGSCAGGTGGGGGTACGNGSAGAGFTGNGGGGGCGLVSYSYLNGGNGSNTGQSCTGYGAGASGGFGGGGGTHGGTTWGGGGGGGYSGGGGGQGSYGGGGGGSYNAGTNQTNTAGANTGHGKVIITTAGADVPVIVYGKAATALGNFNVAGGAKIGEPGVICNSQIEGMIKYSSSTKTFMGCDGTSWSGLISGNTTPDNFSFATQTGLNVATTTLSNIVQINGIISVAVSTSGSGSPQFRTCSNSSCTTVISDWVSAGSIANGKYLQVRQLSSDQSLGTNIASVAVGTTVASWAITTGNTTPSSFSFTVPSLQPLNTVVNSNIVQINGLSIPSLVVVGGSGNPNFRTCSDSTCSAILSDWRATSTTISNSSYLQLRASSPATPNATTTATVSLGTSTVPFYVPSGSDFVNPFSIANTTNAYLNAISYSVPVQITGNTVPAAITVTGGGSPRARACTDSACANPIGNNTYNNTSTGYYGSYQSWTVPTTGTYTIEAWGAEGGTPTSYPQSTGGKGARMRGDFTLTAGEVIRILVGQQGKSGTNDGGGGGGTYVAKQTGNVPLIVAGGGGGGGYMAPYGAGMDAVTATNGTNDRAGSCTGGTNGSGGTCCSNAASGAGFTGNGQACSNASHLPYSFISGNGYGGAGQYAPYIDGGFGGGGATHGGGWGGAGGGGYSGGAGSSGQYGAGGGGSYNSGSNQNNSPGVQVGHGKVIITMPNPVITSGQYLQVLVNAAATASTPTTATVTVGSSAVSATYTTTTGTGSATAFSFTDQTNVARSALILSNIVQITSTAIVGATITGSTTPQIRVCGNSNCSSVVTDWTNAANISSGQYLQARMNSSAVNLTAVTANIAVGDKTDVWSVTTNQVDPTNLVLTHTANRNTFTISWTAGLNNGGAGGCKLQFMDQNVTGTWKDITGAAATLNCDAALSSQTITLPESFTSSWSGTHQVRIFVNNSGLSGGTFPTALSCTVTAGSYNSATATIDEDCNGAFDNTVLYDSYTESCSNQSLICVENYASYGDPNCGNVSSWGAYCTSSVPPCYTPWYDNNSIGYRQLSESWDNGCIWTENIYYYY